jgi:polyisoprenoid-binding protein YceI
MTEASPSAVEQAETATDLFIIDGRASRFTVHAFVTGLLSSMGHSPTIGIGAFGGEVKFNPDKPQAGSFRLAIQASSLSVQDDISDKDRSEIERLMNQEVLETSKFAEILYEAPSVSVTTMSDSLYSATLNGKLTLHGVTRSQPVPARVVLLGSMVRASGEFTLSQSAYSIKPVSVAGGALKIKDELKFSFEIVARKQE